LEVQGAVVRAGAGWRRSAEPWRYDAEKADRLVHLRRVEADQMAGYAHSEVCRLRYLREALDGGDAADCGRCDRCAGSRWSATADPVLVAEADRFLRGNDVAVEPRRQWPSGLDEPRGRIAPARQARLGRALARAGDGGWGRVVAD